MGCPSVQEGQIPREGRIFPLFAMLVSHPPSPADGSMGKTSLGSFGAGAVGISWSSGRFPMEQRCSKVPVDKIPPVLKVPRNPLLKLGSHQQDLMPGFHFQRGIFALLILPLVPHIIQPHSQTLKGNSDLPGGCCSPELLLLRPFPTLWMHQSRGFSFPPCSSAIFWGWFSFGEGSFGSIPKLNGNTVRNDPLELLGCPSHLQLQGPRDCFH